MGLNCILVRKKKNILPLIPCVAIMVGVKLSWRKESRDGSRVQGWNPYMGSGDEVPRS